MTFKEDLKPIVAKYMEGLQSVFLSDKATTEVIGLFEKFIDEKINDLGTYNSGVEWIEAQKIILRKLKDELGK